MKFNWNLQRVGVLENKPSVGEVWIFSRTARFKKTVSQVHALLISLINSPSHNLNTEMNAQFAYAVYVQVRTIQACFASCLHMALIGLQLKRKKSMQLLCRSLQISCISSNKYTLVRCSSCGLI